MNKKLIALGVIALMLMPSNAYAKSRHSSHGYSYYNTDVRYGKRARMMQALGINHHSTRRK